MINIASSQPVHWPVSPVSTAVAPVSAVTAVAPAQRSQGESQSGLGSDHRQAQGQALSGTGQKKASAQEKSAEASQAAPLLPRDNLKGETDTRTTQTEDQASQKAEAEDAKEAEEARSAQGPNLLDVLSNVWKASAAVVDSALGRSEEVEQRLALAMPLSSSTVSGQGEDAGTEQTNEEPPVAYTEQGASEWGALELGRLVSKKA
jgi:hypothetical protein